MSSKQTLLPKALSLCKTFFYFVVLTFIANTLLESDYITSILPLKYLLLILVKIFLSAGVWVSLLEVISQEEIVIPLKKVFQNARDYTKYFACLWGIALGGIFLFSFIVIALKPHEITIVLRHLHFLLLYIFIEWVIRIKYAKDGLLKKERVGIKFPELLILLGLYAADLGIFYSPIFFNLDFGEFQNALSLLLEAVRFLEFIVLALLVIRQYPQISQRFLSEKEIYLISPYPHPSPKIFGIVTSAFESWYPTVFFILRAFTPKQYKIRQFLYTVWDKNYYKPGKLVAITCTTPNCSAAYKIAKGFKAAGSKVIMGGPHVSFVPLEALEFCDSVIIGELEGVWEQVIKDYECGTLKKIYQGEYIDNFYERVHEELMRIDDWGSKFIIENVRGCKYHCDFCLVQPLNGSRLRKKPIPQVIELIRKVKHKTRRVSFIDNNIFNDPEYAKELFRQLIPLNIRWNAFCSIDIGGDPEALELAKKSGCNILIIGYEVINDPEESKRGGKFKLINKYLEYSDAIREAGIKADNAFIYGFDTDRLSNLWKMWKFCFRIRSGVTNISMLTPFAGTKTFREFLASDRMRNLNWRKYDGVHVVFQPKNMRETTMKIVFPIIRNFFYYSTSRIWLRITAVLVALFIIFFKSRYF